jgi:hypothetical protein
MQLRCCGVLADWFCPGGDAGDLAKLEAEAGQIQRRLDGTDKFMSYGHPAIGEWHKHIAARQANGVKVWAPADFTGGDFVQIGLGACYEVIRVIKKTLTLPAIIAGLGRTVLRASESGYPWTDTVPYDKVTARKTPPRSPRWPAPGRAARRQPMLCQGEQRPMTHDRRRHAGSQVAFTAWEPPEMIFEVVTAEGAEGERLAAEQARAMREVMEWLARRRSSTGQGRAA